MPHCRKTIFVEEGKKIDEKAMSDFIYDSMLPELEGFSPEDIDKAVSRILATVREKISVHIFEISLKKESSKMMMKGFSGI